MIVSQVDSWVVPATKDIRRLSSLFDDDARGVLSPGFFVVYHRYIYG